MRTPRDSDFFVDLPGVGRFRYGRRTFGDRAAIAAAMLAYTGGLGAALSVDTVRADLAEVLGAKDLRGRLEEYLETLPDVDPVIQSYAAAIAVHRVLCVESPPGWSDLAEIDLVAHPEWEALAFELYRLVRDAEARFRAGAVEAGAAAGA